MKHRKLFWRIIAILALLIAACCFGYALWYHAGVWQANRQMEAVRKEAAVREEEAVSGSEAVHGETETNTGSQGAVTLEEIEQETFVGEYDGPEPMLPDDVRRGNSADQQDDSIPVDFDVLASYNPELYAWIRIPGTNIDYPVAQHAGEDQFYYLHRDLYGQPQYAGCIFTQAPSAPDFSDPVTILYGHNMKNGSMFQNLHLFLDATFFEEHPYLYVYTKEQALTYRIYAVYPYDSRYLPDSFDFSDEKELAEYLEGTMHPRSMDAQVDETVQVTSQDRIVTLSTCIYGAPDQRLLLQAVCK